MEGKGEEKGRKLIAYAATTNLLSMLRIYIRGANLNFMETNFPASVNGVFPPSRGVDRGADYGMLRSRTIYAARPRLVFTQFIS